MSGRVYRLRRKGVNYFNFDEYNAICKSIENVNIRAAEKKTVFVKATTSAKVDNVASFVDEILKYNGIQPKSYNRYALAKVAFHFNSKEDAVRARDLIALMARPDSIDESKIQTNGKVVSENGINLKVGVVQREDGSATAKSGTGFVTIDNESKSSSQQESANSLTKWLLIGGALLMVIVIAALIIKKMKK